MNIIEDFPQGYWIVDDKKFINKYQALLYAAPNKKSVHYIYFDEVWQNFDRSLIGKFTLNELYKQRAQQLRDKYDYLILYFSGGADSYNVLRSFIDNGIKLDEVCVKWCSDTLTANTTIYTPNTTVNTAYNYLSEWDYAINPVLEELGQSHPEIKINIIDWFKDRDESSILLSFDKVNHWHDCEINSLSIWSPSEKYNIENGLTVGSIYGIDKPAIYFENDTAYMFFMDGAAAMGTPNDINIFGTEYFYYAPDFPILTFEMASAAVQAYRASPILRKYAITETAKKLEGEFITQAWQIFQKEIRHTLYTTWTDRFQALKPMQSDRSDKHWWIFEHTELINYAQMYTDMLQDRLRQVENGLYLTTDPANGKRFYRPIPSKKHFICQVDN
jgi:hypothetical protein